MHGNKTEFIHVLNNIMTVPTMILEMRLDLVHTNMFTKNLGVTFDRNMSILLHVKALCKTTNYLLLCISDLATNKAI